MADVFLSYKKEDRDYVQRVAAALEAAGLSTWWDDRIDPVEQWEKEIWKALDASKAVLVLWTPRAVTSPFVLEEVRRGVKRKRLVQALIESCEIPEEFKGVKTGQQYYDVVGWRAGFEHVEWHRLLQKLKAQCSKRYIQFWPRTRVRHDERHWSSGVLKGLTLAGGAHPGTIFSDLVDAPEMVLVPSGNFVMGSQPDEEGRYVDNREDPQRQIELRYRFAVSRYAITVDQFAIFVSATGHQPRGIPTYWDGQKWDEARRMWDKDARTGTWRSNPIPQSGRHPVVLVSWHDAKAYCEWLSRRTQQHYRLLSEAEWEYCCRAGTATPFYFGRTLSTYQANFNGAHSYGGARGGKNRETTLEVDALPPNDWGIYQMHGNVWEWVEDAFDSYSACPRDGSAHQSSSAEYRCQRGGGWTDPPKHLRSACRGWTDPSVIAYSVGFRIARNVNL